MNRNDEITVINLTNHLVTVIGENGRPITYEPSGIVARCIIQRTKIGYVKDSIPINKTQFVRVIDLPESQENTLYIVSLPVALYSKRNDLIVPDDTIRDNDKVQGCRGFATV